MKKTYKILSIVTVLLMITLVCTNVFAAIDMDQITADKDLGDADQAMTDMGSTILTFVTNAAMILSVVLIAVLGVKYMMGSTEEKAEYKKSLLPYIIGAVLVFAAGAIGKMVVNFASSVG